MITMNNVLPKESVADLAHQLLKPTLCLCILLLHRCLLDFRCLRPPRALHAPLRNLYLILPRREIPQVSVRSSTAPLFESAESKIFPRPCKDVISVHAPDPKSRIAGSFHGWRMGVTLCASTAAIVFIINLVLTIWASLKYAHDGGLGTIQYGSCKRTRFS